MPGRITARGRRVNLDRPCRPLWVYRPVKRSSPDTCGRKPLKNPGVVGAAIGFKSPSSHWISQRNFDAGVNISDFGVHILDLADVASAEGAAELLQLVTRRVGHPPLVVRLERR